MLSDEVNNGESGEKFWPYNYRYPSFCADLVYSRNLCLLRVLLLYNVPVFGLRDPPRFIYID
jgi:hypothetical protein